MPGLVNTHTHAAMTLMRGIADDKPLMEWLQKSIFPAEAKNVSPEFVRDGTTLACMEMVRGGTTTFADMYYYECDVAAAVEACGMRARPRGDLDRLPGARTCDPRGVPEGDARLPRRSGRAAAGSRRPSPRTRAYTCSKETLLAAKALADEYSVPLLIHVSETQDEQKQIQEKYGTTPVRWLDQIGFLGPRVVAAHGVWLDAGDLKLLAAKKATLSHNPESNMKLGSGVAPVVAARKAGVVTRPRDRRRGRLEQRPRHVRVDGLRREAREGHRARPDRPPGARPAPDGDDRRGEGARPRQDDGLARSSARRRT